MKNKELFISRFHAKFGPGTGEVSYYFAPGRINLIGEHIDYNGGFVMPAALSMGIYGTCRKRKDRKIVMRSGDHKNEFTIDLDRPLDYYPYDNWGSYPKGVIKYLMDRGEELGGLELYYHADLPGSSGLSSSAAIEVLTAFIFMQEFGTKPLTLPDTAVLCQKVENEYIGVNCGIMDQFAVAMGRKDHALLLNCATLDYEYIPALLGDHVIAVLNTNKPRALAASAFNERRKECETALAKIRKHKTINDLCSAIPEDLQYISDVKIRNRAEHVIRENLRVHSAADALKRNDLIEFGSLLNASHESLRSLYEVSCMELDLITELARSVKGCLGARMTGAGFGGCAIALLPETSIGELEKLLRHKYSEKTNLKAELYISRIGDGVRKL